LNRCCISVGLAAVHKTTRDCLHRWRSPPQSLIDSVCVVKCGSASDFITAKTRHVIQAKLSTETTQEIQETILGAIQNECRREWLDRYVPIDGAHARRSCRHFNLKLDLPELLPCQCPRHVQTQLLKNILPPPFVRTVKDLNLNATSIRRDTKSQMLCIVAELGMTPT